MKKLITSIVAAAAVMPAFAAPETINLMDKNVWEHKYMMRTPEEGLLRISGMYCIRLKTPAKLDAAKKYTIRGKVKLGENSPVTEMSVGFTLLDKTGRTMPLNNFWAIKDSHAQLTGAVKNGDTVIKIKAENPKVWRPVPGWAVMFQAQKDLSDLPNEKTSADLAKVEKNADGTQTVTLKSPVKYDLPAGTQIRLCSGYSIYFNLYKMKPVTSEWQDFNVSISGEQLPPGIFNGKKFPAGVDSIRLFIMVNWLNKKATTEFKDMVMEIE